MTYLEEWGLTAADDAFHPADDNPWYTETWWSAWMVPERKMLENPYQYTEWDAGSAQWKR